MHTETDAEDEGDLPPAGSLDRDIESALTKEQMNEEEPFSEEQIIGMIKEQQAKVRVP